MFFLKVQCPYAFLQCEQALIDLCAIKPRLLVLVDGIRAPLTSSKVNKRHLPILFLMVTCVLELQL